MSALNEQHSSSGKCNSTFKGGLLECDKPCDHEGFHHCEGKSPLSKYTPYEWTDAQSDELQAVERHYLTLRETLLSVSGDCERAKDELHRARLSALKKSGMLRIVEWRIRGITNIDPVLSSAQRLISIVPAEDCDSAKKNIRSLRAGLVDLFNLDHHDQIWLSDPQTPDSAELLKSDDNISIDIPEAEVGEFLAAWRIRIREMEGDAIGLRISECRSRLNLLEEIRKRFAMPQGISSPGDE